MVLGVQKPTVVLADDHVAVLERVSQLLREDYEVVAAVPDGSAAVAAVAQHKPDIVVLDIAMPVLGGIEAARQMVAAGSDSSIIFLTVKEDPEYMQAATALGALYLLKPHMYLDLPRALDAVVADRRRASASSK